MRTTLDIDDDLLNALMERLPDRSKTEAIETAISQYLRRDAASRLLEAAGTVEIDDTWQDLRQIDRRT